MLTWSLDDVDGGWFAANTIYILWGTYEGIQDLVRRIYLDKKRSEEEYFALIEFMRKTWQGGVNRRFKSKLHEVSVPCKSIHNSLGSR